ncbi:MAG: GGDEF domain-containing protein [Rubrivivax sp.]|nr:MAG: GGDEF domain-containing protein [Rubrivivax sp.]
MSAHRRLLGWLEDQLLNPRSMSSSLLFCLGVLPFLLIFLGLHALALGRPDARALYHPGMLAALQAVVAALALVLAGIACYCWQRRRDERACRWLPQATVTPTVMVLVGLGIAYGLKDTPVGLMVLVTLLLARALFGLQPLKPALCIAATMVLGAEAAQAAGLMAYAPLILAPVYDGTPMAPWWALWTRTVFDASMVSCAGIVFFIFGALARRRRELEHLVRTDMLTGLANRRTFMSQLEIESHRHARSKRPFCLVMCDIDHFKKINDTWGHPAGDAVLVELGRVLRSTTRQQVDTAARIGGEEFAVLLPETDLVQAQHVASMMSQGVRSQIFEFDGQQFRVTQSVGIAQADGGDGDGAFRVADDNLYEAKRAGRDRIVASLASQA